MNPDTIQAHLSLEEWQLVLALRDLPPSPLRDRTLRLVRDLSFYLRQPRCGGLQADGFPCGSPHSSCEECREVWAFLDDLHQRLEASVQTP